MKNGLKLVRYERCIRQVDPYRAETGSASHLVCNHFDLNSRSFQALPERNQRIPAFRLAKLVSDLVIGDADKPFTSYQPGSMVRLERGNDGIWRINWMIRPELLR